MFGVESKQELRESRDHYRKLWLEAEGKTADLRNQTRQQEEVLEAQNAWDRFLQKHEDELVDLRKISNKRKKEIAGLNQELAENQEEVAWLQEELEKAKWIEDSLRFSIDILKQQQSNNPMLEVRQAHQEAEQWQCRYEEAQEKLEALTELLYGLRDDFQFAADDIGSVLEQHGLDGSGEELPDSDQYEFKPVYKTFINGEEIDAATDRHWRERDK
jgi:chromosome segregation ATPase